MKHPLSKYKNTTVLVIGAGGFVGRHVAGMLAASGADVWITDRDRHALVSVGDAFGIGSQALCRDLSDPVVLRDVFKQIKPAVTFNLSGYGVAPHQRDEATAMAINSDLVLEAARMICEEADSEWPGQRMIHAGTAAEYGCVDGTVTEDSPTQPMDLYGKSKLEGTNRLASFCEESGFRAMTARLFMVYGPGELSHRLLPSLLRTGKTGEVLDLTDGLQKRDFVYVGDVAEGLLRLGLLRQHEIRTVNLATGHLTSIRDFALKAAEIIGISTDLLNFGAIPSRQHELMQGAVDTKTLMTLLRWNPVIGPEEGIRITLERHD